MRIQVARRGLFTLLIVGIVGGCGGNGGSSNGVTAKAPDQIVAAASRAIAHAKTAHVAGSIVRPGLSLGLDMSLVSGTGGVGRISQNGLTLRVIALGQDLYIEATGAFWQHYVNPSVARRLQGKWLKGAATGQLAPIASLTNLQTLSRAILLGNRALKKGKSATIAGKPAIAVTSKATGTTYYVATAGPPYPLEISAQGPASGRIVFDRINQPVTLNPPARFRNLSRLR
jgi:hypothetical protein